MSNYGLLHLKHIRPQKDERNRMADFLFRCVQETTKNGRDRDIDLEDYCRSVLSFADLREGMAYLIRFSTVDNKGRPHGNISVAETLEGITVSNLKGAGWTVLGGDTDDSRYGHYYNPNDLAVLGYLYVPDNKHCHTYVIIKRK